MSAVKATENCFSVGAIEEELDHLICAEASKLICSSVKMWLHSNFDSPIVRRLCCYRDIGKRDILLRHAQKAI